MADTTNIMDLPVGPIGGNGIPNNISLSIQEQQSGGPNSNTIMQQQQPGSEMDQNTINRLVTGIQQAGSTGVTQLPSRDIPQTTTQITQDPSIQPNYIPAPTQQQQQPVDYIQYAEKNDEILENYNRKIENKSSLDKMYDELQTPLLLAVLFFLFQLPFFKKYLFMYLPMLFFNDGNYNIYGYFFMSFFFGLIYYVLSTAISMKI